MTDKPRIALIHALTLSMAPINDALAREWPEALRMNLLDDSLSADLAQGKRRLEGKRLRMLNEVPGIATVLIAIMVIVKPI